MTINLNFGQGVGLGAIGAFAVAFSAAWAIYKYPDTFQKWCGMVSWALSFVWKKYEYSAIKWEIQGKINSFVSHLEAQALTSFPRVSVQWSGRDKNEIIWAEDEIVLVMRDRKHKSKNLVNAAYFFTSEALLRKSKLHLSKTQKLSLDLFATKRILEKENPGLEEQFMDDYFVPELEKYPEIKTLIEEYLHIDAKGLFFPVLIQEINFLGAQVFLSNPSAEIVTEIKALIEFLNKFSRSEVHSFPAEDFFGKYTKCAIKIVASRETRESENISVHKDRIERAIRMGIVNIYIIGGTHEGNKDFMRDVCRAVIKDFPNIEFANDVEFDGQIILNGNPKKVKTYLAQLHNPRAIKFVHSASQSLAS